jgi:hypothetical protein
MKILVVDDDPISRNIEEFLDRAGSKSTRRRTPRPPSTGSAITTTSCSF